MKSLVARTVILSLLIINFNSTLILQRTEESENFYIGARKKTQRFVLLAACSMQLNAMLENGKQWKRKAPRENVVG